MEALIAKTRTGTIQGSLDRNMVVFKGIPYAQKPIGTLRWRPPAPLADSTAVLAANQFGSPCVQPGSPPGSFYHKEFFNTPDYLEDMSEDCLYLNVWKPWEARPGDDLPVAFWIHGGAFTNGYGHEMEFDGSSFCARGAILVTINYRLGLFGYFAHPWLKDENPDGICGNYGLLDQIAALDWVRENIGAFGGDPASITVFGQSAGGMSAQAICASPLARGKLHKAIFQSGGGLDPQLDALPLEESMEMGKQFADFLGVSSMHALRRLPAINIMSLYETFTQQQGWHLPSRHVIDGQVLPLSLVQTVQEGRHHPIPYLLGTLADEMELLSPDGGPAARWHQAHLAWANAHTRMMDTPCYFYYFDRKLPGDASGAFHSGELWYVFGTLGRSWRPFEKEDCALAETVADYWCNFIKYGDPNKDGLPLWLPHAPGSSQLMKLGNQIGMGVVEKQKTIGTARTK